MTNREVDSGVGLLVLDVAGGSRVVGAGTAVAAGHLGVATDGVVWISGLTFSRENCLTLESA